MTTIVCIPAQGIMVADSQVTYGEEAGARKFNCEKLYRRDGCIIGTSGESSPGLVFVDWWGSARFLKKRRPVHFEDTEGDFCAIVLKPDKTLWEYDIWCRGDQIQGDFYAIGSGAKAALGALHMGATAVQAVEIACRVDPYTAPPIVTMSLEDK